MFTKKLICLIFCVCFLVSSFFSQTADDSVKENPKARIVKRLYEDVNEKERWELKVNYPELRLRNDKLAQGFSSEARNRVMKYVAEFKKSMAGFTVEDHNFLPEKTNYYMEIGYSIAHLDEKLVSVNFGRSEYTGGVHPNHWSFTLNYDLKNNRAIALEDLFKPGSKFLGVVSENSVRQIVKKQGEFASPDWVNRGAGANLKNFKSWNITKNGLKFSFDPYQVGSYAEGSYETLIPYEKFGDEMRSAKFYDVAHVSYIEGNPPNWCRNGHFPNYGDFKIATMKGRKNSRAYFYKDADDCPNGKNCRRKAYVIAEDELLVANKYRDFACAWYQPRKGNETVGWIKTDQLDIYSPTKKPLFNRWLGNWESNGNSLTIARSSKPRVLKITGNAFWQGMGDNVHIGEVDDQGSPSGNALKIGGTEKYDCRVEIHLVGKLLIVSDNMNCGGVNVTFSGVYSRKR